MKTTRWTSIFLLILLLAFSAYPVLASSSPAAGKISRLVVTNKTPKPVQIKLTGAQNKFITVEVGKSIIELPAGSYKYEYTACGAKKAGDFTLKGKGKLVIAACKMAKIKFVNLTGGNVVLNLSGPERYTFSLPPGITKIQILAGTYTYSGFTVCGSNSGKGTQQFKGKATWYWWCTK